MWRNSARWMPAVGVQLGADRPVTACEKTQTLQMRRISF